MNNAILTWNVLCFSDLLECSAEAGGPLFQVMAHSYTQLLSCCHSHPKATNEENEWFPSICNPCYRQLEDKRFEKFFSKTYNEELHVYPDMTAAIRAGSYPYNGCYMAYALKQRGYARHLIDLGADILEPNSEGLPSYLLEYCSVGKTHYLAWLCSVLSNSNFNQLISHIKKNSIVFIEHCKDELRNPLHALLTGNIHRTKEILTSQKEWKLLEQVDKKQRTALYIAAEMGLEDIVDTF